MVPSGLNWRLASLNGLGNAHDFAHAVEAIRKSRWIEVAMNA